MSCPHRHDGAAYVLGALDPADRSRFEAHLPGCAECAETVRQMAGLPGILAHACVEDLLAEPGTPPSETLPVLLERVRTERRRRTLRSRLTTAAAVVVLAAGGVCAVELLRGDGTAPPPIASPSTDAVSAQFAAVDGVEMWGAAELTRLPGGTQIRISCAYSAQGSYLGTLPYRLVVTNVHGDTDVAGSWHASDGRSEGITLFTRWTPENITAMEIQDLDGQPILRWQR